MGKGLICRGRQQEQKEIEKHMREYVEGISYVVNLYGRGGIGKTVLTKEMYSNFTQFHKVMGKKAKAIYINASGCFDIPELLFRLRMEINDREYNFEKFDTLYELFYDASRFIQYKRIKQLSNKITSDDATERDYTITVQMGDNSEKLSELLLEPLIKSLGTKLYETNKDGLAEFLLQSAEIAGPIIDRISIAGLIAKITNTVKDQRKKRRYINLLKEIKSAQGLFPQETKLLDFFWDALKDKDKKATEKCFYFFIDNFQNPDSTNIQKGNFVFQNLDTLFGMFHSFPAFWFVSSRNHLPKDQVNFSYKLEGLRYDASVEIIKNVDGFDFLINNKDVIDSILSVAVSRTEYSDDNIRFSPIILRILCEVLKKEISNVRGRAPGESKFYVSPELFAEIKNQSALTYYFEMGKSSVDLDCFHILSCADIWDEYTLSVLRNKIQLYLLNTKHILAQDSMIEIIDNHLIKLHDEIAEALRKSASNRIRYDVYAIMYDAFLEIQESVPILDEGILRNFFEFVKAYCQSIVDGVYSYIDIDVLDVYAAYYKAFLKSIYRLKERVPESLLDIYWAVVKEYRQVAQQCNIMDFSFICKAYHELGIIAYNTGDSKKAEAIDKEYLDFVEQVNDVYGLASALNSLAYDLSANHLYSVSYVHGKRSLKVALEGIKSVNQDETAEKLYVFYSKYFMLPEDEDYKDKCLENIENIIKEHQSLFEQIHDIPENAENYIVRRLWEQILKTRGNIPWYFIENPDVRNKSAIYAICYGRVTYLLRNNYYGEKAPSTVQSYHNTGVYLLKYAEYCIKAKICDPSLDIKKAFLSAKDIFYKSFLIRKEFKVEKDKTEKLKYMQELKNTAGNDIQGFLGIYSIADIDKCYAAELSNCHESALESLQYQSYAYYLLALAQQDETEKIRFLQKAIDISDQVIIARSIVLGPCHRKTLESMRYGAEYYWKYGKIKEAEKRIRYAVDHLNANHVPNDQVDEYTNLLELIIDDIES